VKFETPRGRLVVQGKEEDPSWVPPDWHFVGQAKKRGLGIVQLNRGPAGPDRARGGDHRLRERPS
jgi:hypothetical protein